jgi:hypothetical protein
MSSNVKYEMGVEASIRDAMERGDFDKLKGKGKPLNLEDYFDTPEELRVGYNLLRESGFVPPEVELLKEIAALEVLLRAAGSDEEAMALRKAIREKRLKLDILRERSTRQTRRKP